MEEIVQTDVLVIGGGGAAVRAALEASMAGASVALVDKGRLGASGSSPVSLHGLVACTMLGDTPLFLYEDWIKDGCGVNDQNLVWEAAMNSSANLIQLLEYGVEFKKEDQGRFLLYHGAGHSKPRNVTIHCEPPDNPVALLVKKLQQRAVRIHEGIMITRLLKADGAVRGAIGVTAEKKLCVFEAKAIVLACGGANRLYPEIDERLHDQRYRTTGDGFSLAFDAAATIIDMEFSNFRESPPLGSRVTGRYINAKGERFMERYDPERLEKAPRQRTVEAFYTEMLEGRWPIHWEPSEVTSKQDSLLHSKYQGQKRVEVTIDYQRLLGGTRINEKAETDVPHLYAAGESAGGLHGADRLQGAAFLETQIFGARAGYHAAKLALQTSAVDMDSEDVEKEKARLDAIRGTTDPGEIFETVRKMMWDQVGIVRTAEGLSNALERITRLRKETIPDLSGKDIHAALETMNLVLTAEMVARTALSREESRGSHRRRDFPHRDDEKWLRHVALRNAGGEIAVSTLPVQSLQLRTGP